MGPAFSPALNYPGPATGKTIPAQAPRLQILLDTVGAHNARLREILATLRNTRDRTVGAAAEKPSQAQPQCGPNGVLEAITALLIDGNDTVTQIEATTAELATL